MDKLLRIMEQVTGIGPVIHQVSYTIFLNYYTEKYIAVCVIYKWSVIQLNIFPGRGFFFYKRYCGNLSVIKPCK